MKTIKIALILWLALALPVFAGVLTKTADYSIDLADNGSTIVMNSTSNRTLCLPALSDSNLGFYVTIIKYNSGNVTIQAPLADSIADGSANGYVRDTTAGETYASITLMLSQVNKWQIIGAHGTWQTDASTMYFGPGTVTTPVLAGLTLKGTGSYNTTLQAGAASASKTYTLPLTDGTNGYALTTNGSAVLSWGPAAALSAFSSTATGLTYTNTTGVFSLTTGYVIPTTTEETNWNGVYGGTLAGPVGITSANITAGTGTGLTVNSAGNVNRQVYKVTLTYAGLAAADLTADHVIATLPAKTKLVAIYADTTVPYTGGAVSAATLKVGKTTGGAEYIASHDVWTGAVTKGLADADMGTSMTRAAAIQGGDLPSWTATTDVSVRLTTVTANTNALTAGSTTYYLVCERY